VLETVRPRAILFDFYRTLVDIQTDEHDLAAWEVVTSWLRYRGADFDVRALQAWYFKEAWLRLKRSTEAHPEVDVIEIVSSMLRQAGAEPADATATVHLLRSRTVHDFRPFPEAKAVVAALAERFELAVVSDCQECYLLPELRASGLADFFPTIVVSSRYGYRKPDPRLFGHALERIGVTREEAIYVGNSWDRDIVGARNAGIRPVLIARNGNSRPGSDVIVLPDLQGLLELRGPQ
jgi:putative hydrolase of the HAD superfamily